MEECVLKNNRGKFWTALVGTVRCAVRAAMENMETLEYSFRPLDVDGGGAARRPDQATFITGKG